MPTHGSFWKAADPGNSHPRAAEFLSHGDFVFGNGGVAEVLAVGAGVERVVVGDLVGVFGHVGCERVDCRTCRVTERYVECPFGEAFIIGHGKRRVDGTYGTHAVVPETAVEPVGRPLDEIGEEALNALSFSFLAADVLNSLTRRGDLLQKSRILLIGSGMSGLIAAKLWLLFNPMARLVVVDPSVAQLEKARALAPGRVHGVRLSDDEARSVLEAELVRQFGVYGPDVIWDSASSDSTPLWLHPGVVAPDTQCVLFGFGAARVTLESILLQTSGLSLQTSRGPGGRQQKAQALALCERPDWVDFINRVLMSDMATLSIEVFADWAAARLSDPGLLSQYGGGALLRPGGQRC